MSQQPVPAAPATPRFQKWAYTIAGLAIGVVGLVKLISMFSLPSCESSRSIDTLRGIFRQQKIEINSISDPRSVTSSREENTCTAQVDAPGELAAISYRVYWNGWTPQVQITAVKSQPRQR